MVEKDRAVILNKLYLLKMLPSLYQTHLENQLENSELLFFNILINVLQDIKEISIEKIATNLPLPILFNSRRKKLQRFILLPTLNIKKLWLPIIENWLAQNFRSEQTIYLVIDRTNWSRNNLIMLSIIYDKRAIPIYFELLPKLGSSNFEEQKRVFSQILALLKNYKTIVLGDREFCSVQLANWLREQEVEFCLRLKKSENIEVDSGIWQSLDNLGLKPGISLLLNNVKVTKTKKIAGFNLASKWKKNVHSCVPKEGWFILTNLTDLNDAINAYKKRFDIEEMCARF